MYTDLRMLNRIVKRSLHPLITPADAVSHIQGSSKYITCYDAMKGYWQGPLSPDCKLLIVFMTPWRQYKYLRALMGLNVSGDEYCSRGDIVLEGLDHNVKVVEDMLTIYSDTIAGCLNDVREVLLQCHKHHITLNLHKFSFAQESVKFCGYVLSRDGIASDPEKVRTFIFGTCAPAR